MKYLATLFTALVLISTSTAVASNHRVLLGERHVTDLSERDTIKVGADEVSIRNAAERFLRTDIREVDDIVKNVLEGSLRSIVGTLTVEELNLDRQKFQQAVQSAAIGDLATSGLVIDSFTIQAIGGEALQYMELVGRQELAVVAVADPGFVSGIEKLDLPITKPDEV